MRQAEATPAAVMASASAAPSAAPGRVAGAPGDASALTTDARRSGVQLALLITGIALLSVFAIFFMVYAFINYGLLWRSIIIGAVTVAAFVGATVLRRRGLGASGEAVTVFALVLVYLDAFALRANDLFGLASTDARAYWGAVLVASGAGFIAWYREAGVRAASLVGYSAIPLGLGVFAAFLAEPLGTAESTYAVALVIALAGVIQHSASLRPTPSSTGPAVGRRAAVPERVIVSLASAPALLVAAFAATGVAPASQVALGLALLACAAVAALIAWLHHRSATPFDRVAARAWSAAAGGIAALAGAGFGLRSLAEGIDAPFSVIAIPTLGVALLVIATARKSTPGLRGNRAAASLAAGVVAILAVLPAAGMAAVAVLGRLAAAWFTPRIDASAMVNHWEAAVLDPWAALASAVVAFALGAAVLGRLAQLRAVIALAAVLVLLTLPAAFPTLWLAVAGWAVIGAVGFIVRLARPISARAASTVAAVGGTALAWFAGWSSDATWPATSALLIVAALTAHHFAARTASRAILIAVASGAVLFAAMALAEQLSGLYDAVAPAALLTAASLLTLAALQPIRLRRAERRTVYWLALAFAAASVAWILLIRAPEAALPWVTVGGGALLSLGLLLWSNSPSGAAGESRISAILLAPTAAFTLAVAAEVALDSTQIVLLVPALVAAIVAGVALLRSVSGDDGVSPVRDTVAAAPVQRWAYDAGAALALLVPLGAVVSGAVVEAWVVLALAAIALALMATSADGLVGSASRRRHLGWASLAFASFSLWWALDDRRVSAPEGYVLPPAGVLVVVALRVWRREGEEARRVFRASTWILLLGLLLAIVPLALEGFGSGQAAGIRAIATLASSAVLLMVGARVLGGGTAVRAAGLACAALFAGLAGVALVTVLRSINVLGDSSDPGLLESWLVPGALALLVSGVLLARTAEHEGATRLTLSEAPGGRSRSAKEFGSWLFRGALVLAALLEVTAIVKEAHADIRAPIVIVTFAVLHVVAMRWPAAPLGTVTAWLAWALAALAAAFGVASVDTVELVTLPLALALLASGAIRIHRDRTLRSWSQIGPGLAFALLPTFILTFVEPTIWRLVGLGVAGVLTLLAGVAFRLQAPFVLGVGVLLAHALRTFAPQIRAIYEAADWYIWAGIGGVIILAIAIRYEQRMRDLKRVVTRISALR